METLKLTYPSIQAGQEFLMDTDPSKVTQWLNELPFVNLDNYINELNRAVHTLNRSKHRISHREENLYILEQGYLRISIHLREQNNKNSVKSDNKRIKAIHQLTTEFAFGFKHLVDELSQQKMMMRKGQRVAKAINHSIHYLGLMLIEQYQLYAPIPSYIWRELHMLYAYSEEHKYLKAKLQDFDEPLMPMSNIKDSYTRNCIMAVINPYHIQENYHWHIFKYLSHWTHTAYITNEVANYEDSQCFIIDLTDNNKPHFASDEIEYLDGSKIRLLKTTDFMQQIKEQLNLFTQKHITPTPGFYSAIEPNQIEKMLQRMYAYCDHHIQRQSARYPILADVDTVWGINPILKIANNTKKLPNDRNLDIGIQDLLGDNYTTNIRWQAVNHSDGGMCLKQVKQDVDELHIGELVIIKRHINQKPQRTWQLAITRWLNGEELTGSTVGLEFIHGEVSKIEYLTRDKDEQLVRHSVILIKPFDKSYPILIVPKNLIGRQKEVMFLIDDKQRTAHLTTVIETSSQIALYGVRFD